MDIIECDNANYFINLFRNIHLDFDVKNITKYLEPKLNKYISFIIENYVDDVDLFHHFINWKKKQIPFSYYIKENQKIIAFILLSVIDLKNISETNTHPFCIDYIYSLNEIKKIELINFVKNKFNILTYCSSKENESFFEKNGFQKIDDSNIMKYPNIPHSEKLIYKLSLKYYNDNLSQ